MWAVFMVARYEQKAEIVRQHKSRDAFLVKRRSCSDSDVSHFTNNERRSATRCGATPFNTLLLMRMQVENRRSGPASLAEIATMKNQTGKKEEKRRVGCAIGDNQQQVRPTDFQMMHDMAL